MRMDLYCIWNSRLYSCKNCCRSLLPFSVPLFLKLDPIIPSTQFFCVNPEKVTLMFISVINFKYSVFICMLLHWHRHALHSMFSTDGNRIARVRSETVSCRVPWHHSSLRLVVPARVVHLSARRVAARHRQVPASTTSATRRVVTVCALDIYFSLSCLVTLWPFSVICTSSHEYFYYLCCMPKWKLWFVRYIKHVLPRDFIYQEEVSYPHPHRFMQS